MADFIKSTVEGFLEDSALGYGEDFAGEHFQPTKDPFYEQKKDKNGEIKEVKRRLPDNIGFTKNDSKHWKSVQTKAWIHDKSICGCCCWTDFIGWAPIVTILPIIGPLCMYSVHKKLIVLADKHFNLSGELKAKMYGNIGIDLAISLVPILGSVFSWLHGCSTRNAAMIYNFIVERQTEEYNHNRLAGNITTSTDRGGASEKSKYQRQQPQPIPSQRANIPQQRAQSPPPPSPSTRQTQQSNRAVPQPNRAVPQPPIPQRAYHQNHTNARKQPYPPQETYGLNDYH